MSDWDILGEKCEHTQTFKRLFGMIADVRKQLKVNEDNITTLQIENQQLKDKIHYSRISPSLVREKHFFRLPV